MRAQDSRLGKGSTDKPLAGERGSVQPLIAIVLGGVALALAVVVVGTVHRVRVAQVQWAADAAARAAAAEVVPEPVGGGVDGGLAARAAAERVAAANGGELVELRVVMVGDRGLLAGGGGGAVAGGAVEGRAGGVGVGVVPVSPSVVVTVSAAGVEGRSAAARVAIIPP